MDQVTEAMKQAGLTVLPWDGNVYTKLAEVISGLLHNSKAVVSMGPRVDVISAILHAVQERQAGTIVVEGQYVDADYLETYARHYSRNFQERRSKCLRLHFFVGNISPSDLLAMSEKTRSGYLGYCILRPTGNQYVGRTVIVPPNPAEHDARFIPAASRFKVHLLGHELEVTGAPFIQQDAVTFVCAGAAIWSVSYFMHVEHDAPRYYPAQITDIARESLSHGQVRKGLTTLQISMTLHRMGLNPYVESFQGLSMSRS